MTKTDTITKFHLYMDDSSDLSSTEESDLYDKVLDQIYTDRPWEFLKQAATGTQSTTVPYIALPADFQYLVQNNNYSEMNADAKGPVIFVGASYTPYKVVSWSDRRQYRNQDGYAYIEIGTSRLYFTAQPTVANSIEYDYHYLPTHLAGGGSPVFPDRFAKLIFHGMCIDDFVIQQSDKAKSYLAENKSLFDAGMLELAFYNANLIQLN